MERNDFLKRTELVCLFSGQAGKIDRNTVRQQVAESIKTDPAKVYLLGLKTTSGSTDLEAKVVTYEDENEARRQLPNYLSVRLLPKGERNKKSTAPAPTSAPAKKKVDDKEKTKADDKKEKDSS